MLHTGKQNSYRRRRRSERPEKKALALAPRQPATAGNLCGNSADRQQEAGEGGDTAVKAMGAAPSLEKADAERKGGNQMMARGGSRARQKGFQNRETLSCLWKGRSQKERRLVMSDELIFLMIYVCRHGCIPQCINCIIHWLTQ